MTWMDRYTLPDSTPLWSAVHRGDGRAVVTDGRTLLAVDDPAATFAQLELPAGNPGVSPAARRLLAEPPPADAMWTDLGDLWLWLDRVERERCRACGGTGNAIQSDPGVHPPRFVACEECDARGWHLSVPAAPDADTVMVCGRHLDRNRVAWWLAGELAGHGDHCRVWPTHTGMMPAATFAGDHWRLVVAAMSPEIHRGRYRAYHPGLGLWWVERRCGTARCAARDWAQDRGIDPLDVFGERPQLEAIA